MVAWPSRIIMGGLEMNGIRIASATSSVMFMGKRASVKKAPKPKVETITDEMGTSTYTTHFDVDRVFYPKGLTEYHFTGKNFDASRDIAQTASLIRQEIKSQISEKKLPKVKYSIRIQRYPGGQSLRMTIKGLPFPLVTSESLKIGEKIKARRDRKIPQNHYLAKYSFINYGLVDLTPKALDVLQQTKAILKSYNSESYIMGPGDGGYNHFYESVEYDLDYVISEREKVQHALKKA